jgi:hypothetical protein
LEQVKENYRDRDCNAKIVEEELWPVLVVAVAKGHVE